MLWEIETRDYEKVERGVTHLLRHVHRVGKRIICRDGLKYKKEFDRNLYG